MIIISGLMPGHQGVGRLLSHLKKEATNQPEGTVSFIFGPSGTAGGKALRKGRLIKFIQALWKICYGKIRLWAALRNSKLYETEEPVLLIHFQTLGYRWCKRFIENRSKPTWLYLMDSGFFCIRSYNHVPGEHKACLRCLGGNWQHAKKLKCPKLPKTNFQALKLVTNIKNWVEKGKIKLIAQNRIQAELAHLHFGENVPVKIAGLWTVDWPEPKDIPFTKENSNGDYDVVYHASSVPAKGFIWAIELAKHCPDLKFLFPCFKSDLWLHGLSASPNTYFDYMSWETGLGEQVRQAKMVLVPSLWSAPIEGALLKSIIFARSVAVVNEPTTYATELPDQLVHRLPLDVTEAAKVLIESVKSDRKADEQFRRKWVNKFYEENRPLLNKLFSFCQEN